MSDCLSTLASRPSGPSATDIITYIGVPLAVLGVLPILWNVSKSFQIRHRLVSWIPKEARKNISLNVDPAAGVVVAVVDGLRLTWQSISDAMAQDDTRSLVQRSVGNINPRLIGGSWMGLYQAKVPFIKIRGASQRLVIDSSMYFRAPAVRCDWETFVFLALALGIDPYSNNILELSSANGKRDKILSNAKGESMLTMRNTSDHVWIAQLEDNLSFSGRKALAWYCYTVIKDGSKLHYSPLAVNIAPNYTTAVLPNIQTILSAAQNIETIIGSDNRYQVLQLAFTWVLYVESVFYGEGNDELLPIPQFVLKSREDVLSELRGLGSDTLKAALNDIFQNNGHMVARTMECLEQAWRETIYEEVRGRRKGQEPRDVKDCRGCLNLYQYCSQYSLLQLLGTAFHPDPTRRQHIAVDLQDLNQPVAICARVWLGLSAVQAGKRSEWEINLDLSGQRLGQSPGLGWVTELLSISKVRLKQVTIQID